MKEGASKLVGIIITHWILLIAGTNAISPRHGLDDAHLDLSQTIQRHSSRVLNTEPIVPILIEADYEVLRSVVHDGSAFTQGLEMIFPEQTQYFESTGRYGRSSIRRVDLETGEVYSIRPLDDSYFGEGMTFIPTNRDATKLEDSVDGTLVQITWKSGTGFVYNATNLDVLKEFTYETSNGQGWGICYNPEKDVLYVSDGTSFLHTWDPESFDLVSRFPVSMMRSTMQLESESVTRINELEWDFHSQSILANVWQTNYIIRIDPETGFVTHRYDMTRLKNEIIGGDIDVLNGIAVTSTPNEVWVTGKLWPIMYLVRFEPPTNDTSANANDEGTLSSADTENDVSSSAITMLYWPTFLLSLLTSMLGAVEWQLS